LTINDSGKITGIANHQCKRGREYAEQEYKSPQRVLTATVRTDGSIRPLLPVRTNKAIPKDMLIDCMSVLADVRVKPVLTIGEVIIQNIIGTGANVVCSDELAM